MKIIQQGRLKFGQLGGSVGIPPGMGYQAHRITVSNTEGGYPNICENVKAEIVLTFLHTGETHRIAGLFSRTDGQKITSEPAQRVSLPMLESSELLLLCRDSINREFRTLSRWPFHPESEMRLEFGDWRLEVVASCDSNLDAAGVFYDVRLKPDLSSAWSPFQNLLPVSNTPRATATLPKAFVSHSSQDQKFVENFAADLRANGVDAWYSGWEIKPGDSIRKKIDDGLEGCEYFIIVLSKNSISRPWVQAELDAATIGKLNGRVRRIIPIKIEDCGDLPPTLASLCWEDFSSQSYHSALKRVLYSIFEIDDKPPLGSPPSVAPSERGQLQITSLTGASGDLPVPPTKPGGATSFPIHMDDLGVFAEQLRRDGFDARGDLFNGQVGLIVGPKGLDRKRLPPDAKGLFFPLWEINHKANRPLLSARKFHEVVESRPPDWRFNRPSREGQQQLGACPNILQLRGFKRNRNGT